MAFSTTTTTTIPSCALLFAGQGTDVQRSIIKLTTGAWAEDAKDYFTRASAVLGYDLLDVCLNQPEKLKETTYSQLAIFVTSLATVAKAQAAAPFAVSHLAGFSLGEYSALVYAGSLTFEDGVRLLKTRAEAMQVAALSSSGSMVTVVGLSDEQLERLCRDAVDACNKPGETITIANHLFAKGRVLSGHTALVKWVVENAATPKYGALVATELSVAGAFHSRYMASARTTLHGALSETDVKLPKLPLYSNVTAKPYTSVNEIRELLVQQLESPVHWEQTIQAMLKADSATSFVDAGPGMQLQSMMRRIDPKAFKATIVLDK